ncbi:MAG: amino acid ABC transporter substrate-binding protein [Chloroflexota bacterium]
MTEIRIGVINSMTGENAMTGVEQKWAQEQAAADINAKGGIKLGGKMLPIKLVFADDKSQPTDAAASMERLINLEKVKIILGSNTTPINEAAATVAEKYKAYFHINTSWLDFIDSMDYQWVSDMFFTAPSAAEVPYQIWDLQPAADRPKSIALLMEDNPDGQGFGGGFKAFAEQHGYKITVDEPYTPGTKDFSSTILKMKQANADAVLWLGSPPDSITLIRGIKEQQLNLKYIHGWKGFWNTEFQKALGKDSDYIIHDGFWAETLPFPGAKELGQKFKDTHGGLDSVSIGLPYASLQVLAMAIERAGSLDPAAVRDQVWGGTFKGTVNGDVTYNAEGLSFSPSLALQWWQGQRMPIWPAGLSDWQLKWMPPWNQR